MHGVPALAVIRVLWLAPCNPPRFVPPSFASIAGLALGISGQSGLLVPSVAVCNGLRRAWLFWHIEKPAFSAQSLFNFQKERRFSFPTIPASIRLMQARLTSYRACSVPQSCLPLLILIIIALALIPALGRLCFLHRSSYMGFCPALSGLPCWRDSFLP